VPLIRPTTWWCRRRVGHTVPLTLHELPHLTAEAETGGHQPTSPCYTAQRLAERPTNKPRKGTEHEHVRGETGVEGSAYRGTFAGLA
jgi:hypothetical protein